MTDVAAAFVAAAGGELAGTYNVGTGRETSTTRLLEILQDAAGTAIEPSHEGLQSGELRSSALDSSAIERDLGWRPTVDAETGLRQTLDWYRAARR